MDDSKVVQLHKGKGSELDQKNYRPDAIYLIMSKVLERAMFQQPVIYMDSVHWTPTTSSILTTMLIDPFSLPRWLEGTSWPLLAS